MSEHQMQIEMEGLITVLAENLYADPNVFVREMIQNAHDGIAKRLNRLADGNGEVDSLTPEIRIFQNGKAGTLSFCDNGAGLSRDEIHRYLSTIGSSDKRQLNAQSDHQSICNMIGQFGIGMLSSFIVADKVEVLTRSDFEAAFLWSNKGGASYRLEDAEKEEVGTRVTLYLKGAQQRFLDSSAMAGFVRSYADIIGVPIFLNQESTPVNRVDAPWHLKHSTEKQHQLAHEEYWQSRFSDDPAVDILPIEASFTYMQDDEEKTGQVAGTLVIVAKKLPGIDSSGVVDLFVSRMFIGSGMKTVLPPWASFIHGVIESASLKPNAARDNIMPDKALAALKETLGRLVLQWLQSLAEHQPARLRDIMRYHLFQILAMSIQPDNRAFFLSVADLLPLESNYGTTTMADYLKQAEVDEQGIRTIYYFPDSDSSTQSFMLAEAKNIQAINAGYHLIEEFLYHYEITFPGTVRLKKISSDSQRIFEAVSEDEEQRFDHLRKTCDRLFDVQTIVSRFQPNDVSLLMVDSDLSQSQQEMEDLSDNPAVSGYLRDLMGKFVNSQRQLSEMHLNIDNGLVKKLAILIHTSRAVAEQVLILLYNNAVLLYARRIRPKQVKALFEHTSATMETLLDAAELIEQQQEQLEHLQLQLDIQDKHTDSGKRLM